MSSLTQTPNNTVLPNPIQKAAAPANPKQLTYDEVSKHFSLPLADAAESLGVCVSVLKKICHDNGLARWPYRKFLLGKSIEQIKKDAAREMVKRQREVVKISGSTDNSAMSTAASFLSSQPQNKTSSSLEVSKSHAVTQPQVNKSLHLMAPQTLHTSSYMRGAENDEFMYGFPSQGLSTVSYRWWAKSSSSNSTSDVTEDSENNGQDVSTGSLETGTLTSLRKRAAEEGQEALKLGLHSRYSMNTLDSSKKMVLQQIFKPLSPTLV